MKPKLRVGLSVSHIIDGSGVSGPPLLMISATNYGPGQITCGMAAVKKSSLFRKIGRRVRRFTVVQDFTNPLCAQLPKRLNMAEEINLVFPYNQGCFLKLRPTHVGLYDSFGRYHSAPRRQVRRAISDYKKDFPNQANS